MVYTQKPLSQWCLFQYLFSDCENTTMHTIAQAVFICSSKLKAQSFLLRSSARALRTLNPTPSQSRNSRSIFKKINSITQLCGHWRDLSRNTESKSKMIWASRH